MTSLCGGLHNEARSCPRIPAPCRKPFGEEETLPIAPHGKAGPAGPVCLCEEVVRDPIHSKGFPLPVNVFPDRALH